jgi:hypothetical protein
LFPWVSDPAHCWINFSLSCCTAVSYHAIQEVEVEAEPARCHRAGDDDDAVAEAALKRGNKGKKETVEKAPKVSKKDKVAAKKDKPSSKKDKPASSSRDKRKDKETKPKKKSKSRGASSSSSSSEEGGEGGSDQGSSSTSSSDSDDVPAGFSGPTATRPPASAAARHAAPRGPKRAGRAVTGPLQGGWAGRAPAPPDDELGDFIA